MSRWPVVEAPQELRWRCYILFELRWFPPSRCLTRSSELERIEVLPGPQGRFYGASSIGGLIQYVTVDPSRGFSGRLEGDLSGV